MKFASNYVDNTGTFFILPHNLDQENELDKQTLLLNMSIK